IFFFAFVIVLVFFFFLCVVWFFVVIVNVYPIALHYPFRRQRQVCLRDRTCLLFFWLSRLACFVCFLNGKNIYYLILIIL
ncbi:hypothetical protein EY742_22625, partial [Salmonella enterica subsp. enterica serovar Typhimurium]